MKKLAIFSVLLVLIASCDKEHCGDQGLPICLQQKVEIYRKDATENPCPNYGVKEYAFEGKSVYVFGTPACIADGVDFVLNAQCDTICYIGGFSGNPNCNGKAFYANAVFKRDIWKP